MIGTALCVIFLAISLNILQISAENSTSQESTTISTNEPSSSSSSSTDNSMNPKEDIITTATETYTELAATKSEERDPNEIATKMINSDDPEKSNEDSEHKATIPPKYITSVNEDVDDIIESLLTKPEWTFRDDRIKSITSMSGEENAPNDSHTKPDSGYFGKLPGSLVLPALKASDRFSKAWNQASQGTKDIGGGAYKAAVGTFDFFKSAATAVLLSG